MTCKNMVDMCAVLKGRTFSMYLMYAVFPCMPGERYCRQFRSLMLCACDIFQAQINSFVCWVFSCSLKQQQQQHQTIVNILKRYNSAKCSPCLVWFQIQGQADSVRHGHSKSSFPALSCRRQSSSTSLWSLTVNLTRYHLHTQSTPMKTILPQSDTLITMLMSLNQIRCCGGWLKSGLEVNLTEFHSIMDSLTPRLVSFPHIACFSVFKVLFSHSFICSVLSCLPYQSLLLFQSFMQCCYFHSLTVASFELFYFLPLHQSLHFIHLVTRVIRFIQLLTVITVSTGNLI